MKSVILNQSMMPNLDNLFEQYPLENVFYFEPGTYYLSQQLNIVKPNIQFIGLSYDAKDVHIEQQNIDANGMNVRADNFTMTHISVHVEDGEMVCLSHSGCNWTNIQNCRFYGSSTNFTIYFAGPQFVAGENTINGYLNDTLDMYNCFDNNIVYTKWEGDSVSFSLQKYGSVRNNIIRGGKLAIYMVKDCMITHNNIYDSYAHGIIVSLPSYNLEISNNFIRNPVSAGINVRLQAEHGEYINENHNINIKENTIIASKYIGIEINNGHSINIANNFIKCTEQFSIYLLQSTQNTITDNICVQAIRGILIDADCNDNIVSNNHIFSVFPKMSDHAIAVLDNCSNNTISDNQFSGRYTSTVIKDITGNNSFNNNSETTYHDYHDEVIQLS